MRFAARSVMVAIAVCAALVGCGSGGTHPAGGSDPAGSLVAGTVTVFAAASLTGAFGDIAEEFEAVHPQASVRLNFASSSDLVTQIDQGAPADVYASADEANMARLTKAGHNGTPPVTFATNELRIVVEPGNPKNIANLADLAADGIVYVTCAPEVPIGRYSAQVLATAGVNVTPASFEENVKGVVAKVGAGEADAGIVYATDVVAAGAAVAGVEIPAAVNVTATYPLVVTKDATNPVAARAFVDFVLGPGRRILAAHGFGPP